MTRKREHRMTVRLNGDEYTKVLSKIERSGLSKQDYMEIDISLSYAHIWIRTIYIIILY
ncbi:plasmid mobilization protein [Holdemanella biformis]|uniref:plasmid mobilization protein n=1 Tax=Holdemanella biformis TaxID=1735 RepID=UPI002E777F95|nr:hypothetical protein [Holdemanella biformis]